MENSNDFNFDLGLDLTAGMQGGALSGKRIIADDTPIVRTTPTPGNILVMDPAAEAMLLGHGSRVVVTELPGSLGSGRVVCEYPVETRNGKTLAIHAGINDHIIIKTVTETDELGNEVTMQKEGEESFGNKAAKAGHGIQFSSLATWAAMGGNKDENVLYKINTVGYIGLGIVQEGGKMVARPYTAAMHASAPAAVYLVIDCEKEELWSQVTPSNLDISAVTPYWILSFERVEEKQKRAGAGAGKKEVSEDADDDALSMDDAFESLDEDDDLGL
jgi:hypothetical protein